MASRSRELRSARAVDDRQSALGTASGSRITADFLPARPAAKSRIHWRYVLPLALPPAEYSPQSRCGMLYATNTGSAPCASAAETPSDTSPVTSVFQSPIH